MRLSWLRAGWRFLRLPLILVVLYLVLRLVLAALSERQGFGSPDGTGLAYLAVAAAVSALRVGLLVLVPAVLAYRLVVQVTTRLLGGADAPAPPSNAESDYPRAADRDFQASSTACTTKNTPPPVA
ncbi:hypothetical protein [Nocardia sp. NPDC052566]|uniref:hypothetical protein n=1 Tax=Nocardia sp. NPDC052566 TaxID=3364330 RepID=UPI0037C52D3F